MPNFPLDAPTDKKNGLLDLDAVVPSRPIVIRPIAQEVRRLLHVITGRAGLLLYFRDPRCATLTVWLRRGYAGS